MHLRHAGQAGQILTVDTGEIVGILRYDLQKIVRRPGHQMALQHIGHPAHLAFERLQHLVGLPRKGDFHENRGGPPHPAGIKKCYVAVDEPFHLQPLHPPVAGRW